MMKKLFLLSMLLLSYNVCAAEKYMPNDSGGFVVLTEDNCTNEDSVKAGYLFRAYATETNSEDSVKHEGCWISPSTEAAPKIDGFRIIAVVNSKWDGEKRTWTTDKFSNEKKRWNVTPIELTLPPIIVTPDNK